MPLLFPASARFGCDCVRQFVGAALLLALVGGCADSGPIAVAAVPAEAAETAAAELPGAGVDTHDDANHDGVLLHLQFAPGIDPDNIDVDYFADDGTGQNRAWVLDSSGLMPNDNSTWVHIGNDFFVAHPKITRLRAVVQRQPWSAYEGELNVSVEAVREANRTGRIFTLHLKEVPHKTVHVRMVDPLGQTWPAHQLICYVCSLPDGRGRSNETNIGARLDAKGCLNFCIFPDQPAFAFSVHGAQADGEDRLLGPCTVQADCADGCVIDFPARCAPPNAPVRMNP